MGVDIFWQMLVLVALCLMSAIVGYDNGFEKGKAKTEKKLNMRYVIKCKMLLRPEHLKTIKELFKKKLDEDGVIVVPEDMFDIQEIPEGADLEWLDE